MTYTGARPGPRWQADQDGPAHRTLTVAELRELGKVKRDEDRPGRPVVEADLSGRRVTDATMELVGELMNLQKLSLEDTRVTDAGIRRIGH